MNVGMKECKRDMMIIMMRNMIRIMDNMDIMDIMDIMEIIDIINIMNITALMVLLSKPDGYVFGKPLVLLLLV